MPTTSSMTPHTGTRQDRTSVEEPIRTELGRRAPFTQVGDWVALAPISAAAKALYWCLAMHMNVQAGSQLVFPSRASLAAILGYSRADKIDRYITELEGIGAIDVRRDRNPNNPQRRRNVYVIHMTPPPGYQHHGDLESFYAECREQGKRKETAGQPKTPKRGPQKTRDAASSEAPKRGLREAPKRGLELDEGELEKDLVLAPRSDRGAAPPDIDPQPQPEKTSKQRAVLTSVGAQVSRVFRSRFRPTADELPDASVVTHAKYANVLIEQRRWEPEAVVLALAVAQPERERNLGGFITARLKTLVNEEPQSVLRRYRAGRGLPPTATDLAAALEEELGIKVDAGELSYELRPLRAVA